MKLAFTVFCRPEPQGSARAFIPKGWSRPVITSANKELKSFRQQVSVVAHSAMITKQKESNYLLQPFEKKASVRMILKFYFHRPKSKKSTAAMTTRPDLDKLVRAIGDALIGICYHDDSQVNDLQVKKLYGEPERTEIEIEVGL